MLPRRVTPTPTSSSLSTPTFPLTGVHSRDILSLSSYRLTTTVFPDFTSSLDTPRSCRTPQYSCVYDQLDILTMPGTVTSGLGSKSPRSSLPRRERYPGVLFRGIHRQRKSSSTTTATKLRGPPDTPLLSNTTKLPTHPPLLHV